MKMKRRILQRDKPVQKRSKDTATRELIKNSIRALDGEGNERKFILSFSSEEPYQRFWGTEILDHSEGAVDLTRIQEIGCLPLLQHLLYPADAKALFVLMLFCSCCFSSLFYPCFIYLKLPFKPS